MTNHLTCLTHGQEPSCDFYCILMESEKAFTNKTKTFISCLINDLILALTWSIITVCTNCNLKVVNLINAFWQFLQELVCLAVEICHQGTLPSATPSFPVGENFENWQKYQMCSSIWVGQAYFGKLKLNNGNHSSNCQCLLLD